MVFQAKIQAKKVSLELPPRLLMSYRGGNSISIVQSEKQHAVLPLAQIRKDEMSSPENRLLCIASVSCLVSDLSDNICWEFDNICLEFDNICLEFDNICWGSDNIC